MSITFGAETLQLIFTGAFLFVVGLFQGLLIPFFKNPRMGLSAHLTAVQTGTAIMVFGVIWSLIELSPFVSTIAKSALIAGNYLIWSGITLAAITGASEALPIAGKGFHGARLSEIVVKTIEIAGVVLSLLSGVLILYGLGINLL